MIPAGESCFLSSLPGWEGVRGWVGLRLAPLPGERIEVRENAPIVTNTRNSTQHFPSGVFEAEGSRREELSFPSTPLARSSMRVESPPRGPSTSLHFASLWSGYEGRRTHWHLESTLRVSQLSGMPDAIHLVHLAAGKRYEQSAER